VTKTKLNTYASYSLRVSILAGFLSLALLFPYIVPGLSSILLSSIYALLYVLLPALFLGCVGLSIVSFLIDILTPNEAPRRTAKAVDSVLLILWLSSAGYVVSHGIH
jgi:hypothetical protein